MNPLLSSLNVQTWATCWAHACKWLLLRALASPSLRLHRCHRWCAHWRRCRHHPSNSTQALICDLEDDHPVIECLGAPSQSQVWSVKHQGTSNRRQRNGRGHGRKRPRRPKTPTRGQADTPAQRHAQEEKAVTHPQKVLSTTVLGTGPRSFESRTCCVGLGDGAHVEGITPITHRRVLPGSCFQGEWTLLLKGIAPSSLARSGVAPEINRTCLSFNMTTLTHARELE